MSDDQRRDTLPNASSPAVLTSLLEGIARGLRTHRALQEWLSVEGRTVQYYLRTAEWLGLAESADQPCLTALGLEYVYADRRRPEVFARAVWQTPFVTRLMRGRPEALPSLEEVTLAVLEEDPTLATATAERRASSVRSLLAPTLGIRRRRVRAATSQLALPLALRSPSPAAPRIEGHAGREYNPDVYRLLAAALLDHGELGLGQIRALLDRAELGDAPIGGYVELALRRGDATRLDDRVVASAGLCARRELVATASSIILSDPEFRRLLDLAALPSPPPAQAQARAALHDRYRGWARRLLGSDLPIGELPAAVARLVLDRPVHLFPLAGAPGEPLATIHQPFLDVWTLPDLPVALPEALDLLRGGLPAVNRLFKNARQNRLEVRPPDLADRALRYHGGLLHPGEPLPRSVPDTRSLRQRVLMHAPYAAMVAALLLHHRRAGGALRLRRVAEGWAVQQGRVRRGPLLRVLDDFARQRGWIVCRRDRPGADLALIEGLEAIGVISVIADIPTLSEPFFAALRQEAEEMEVAARLGPLADALAEAIDHMAPYEEEGG